MRDWLRTADSCSGNKVVVYGYNRENAEMKD